MATTRGSGRTKSDAEDETDGVGDLSYSDAGAELDAIIEEFETGVIDVDRLVDQLQRATDIVDELDQRLRRTRMQVEELVPRLEAIGQTEDAGDEVDEVLEVELEEEDGGASGFSSDDGEPSPPGLF
jgi:exodeoxyribonuclease VII small subunit